ncbi:MAG: hypothetical protein PHI58_00085 [Candidatus Omnitrophica bacterium]|nr:hypothetical protein [Candidatus Omnitrophota bacterium]
MYTKQQILEEIKRIALKLGVQSLKHRDFNKNSKMSLGSVRYYFGSWNNAIKEAGLKPIDPKNLLQISREKRVIKDDDLLLDLIRLYNEFGKEPTEDLINAKGKYSGKPYRVRWKTAKNAFLIAKNKFSDMLQVQTKKQTGNVIVDSIKIIPSTRKQQTREKRKTTFGEPINFRGIRFAPVNEQGVVYLFGMIAHELGYLIESIRTEYPDCEGKRCFDKEKNQWEHVKIEFEYKSSHFKEHGHNEQDCDIIICWIHDWNDCPLEVLDLRSVITYLSNKG